MLALIVAGPALAAGEPSIAKAVGVRPEATGQFNGSTLVLRAEDDLYEGQKIITGASGQVQIVFADETHMVVGPGSSLVIEKYLMRNGGTASQFAVSALGGTFRFITGKSSKSAYKIDTPTGTIGVRGTKFDFTVTPMATDVVLFEGEVTYCAKAGGCASVKGKCDIGAGETSDAQVISSGSSSHASATDQFIYVKSQNSLKSDFKVSGASACGSRSAPEQTTQNKPPKSDPAPPPDKPPAKPEPVPDPLPDPTP